MKYSKYILIHVVAIIVACSSTDEQPIATVGNQVIHLTTYKERYKMFLGQSFQKDNLMNRFVCLNGLIDEKLLLDYAKSQGIGDKKGYQKKEKALEKQLVLNHYFDEVINIDFDITDEELRNLYKWKNTTFHIRHLFARDIDTINQIKSSLDRGIAWNILAGKYFSDPKLRNNGGDIGWYRLGELDPVFEFNAFSLRPDEVSDVVRTKDGYSIIHLIESEFDGLLTESGFRSQAKDLKYTAINYKQKAHLLHYTDKMIESMDIQFDHKNLKALHQFFISENDMDFEKMSRNILVKFGDQHWDVQKTTEMLADLSNDQLSKIAGLEHLKDAIKGLLCRDRFMEDANKMNIKDRYDFKLEFSQEKEKLMIADILGSLELNENKDEEPDMKTAKEKYFHFRDELSLRNSIKIDSLLVRKFIM